MEKDVKRDLFLMRLNSFLSEINKKSYINKNIFKDFTMYYYPTHIDVFIKNIESNLIKNIKNQVNFNKCEDLWLISTKSGKKLSLNPTDIELENKIQSFIEKNEASKIRFFFKNY